MRTVIPITTSNAHFWHTVWVGAGAAASPDLLAACHGDRGRRIEPCGGSSS